MGCIAGISKEEGEGDDSGREGACPATGDKTVVVEGEEIGEVTFSGDTDEEGIGEATSIEGRYEVDVAGEESGMSGTSSGDMTDVSLGESGGEEGLELFTSTKCVGESDGISSRVGREKLTGNVKGRSPIAHT
jgi:hypothetical protein